MRVDGRPILDTRSDARLFVGRGDEVSTIGSGLSLGLNVLVAGERGSGRTSLLRHLQHVLREDHRDVTYLDAVGMDAEQLLVLVRERIVGPSTLRRGGGLGGPTEQWSDRGGLLREIDILSDHFREAAAFAESVGEDEPARWTVLLDTPPAASAHTLFGRLRDEIWNLPVTWVVTIGLDEWSTVLREPADAFFESRVVLGPFGPHEAADLLARRVAPGGLAAEVVAEIVRRADGSPRRLIAMARDVVAGGEDGLRALTDRHDRRRDLLRDVSPSARQLADAVTARGGSVSASDEGIRQELGWTRGRVSQVFQELSAAGLVVSSPDAAGGPGRPRKLYSLVMDVDA